MVLNVPRRRTAAQAPVPSKLNGPASVPTRPATVKLTVRVLDDPIGAVQRTDVWPIHCVDAQTADPTEAVGEDRWAPKLDPRNVSE
jgi:hypothetical protein